MEKGHFRLLSITLAVILVVAGIVFVGFQSKSILVLPRGYELNANIPIPTSGENSSSSTIAVNALMGHPDPYSSTGGIFMVSENSRISGEITSTDPVALLILTGSEVANISVTNFSDLKYGIDVILNFTLPAGAYQVFFVFKSTNVSAVNLLVTEPIIANYAIL